MITTLLAVAASLGQPPAAPAGASSPPVPSAAQLAWHDLEFYGFIHFTTNTFTGREWGHGDESPAIFNPSALDTRQWARIAKAAGMKGLILTAKHHDGFCLWPSALTEHSVKASPWKDGKGDVVGELSKACREEGLLFGIYLSPWDRNHAQYGRPAYIDYYRGQLTELLTNYGPVFEVWQDGANGGDGYYGGARERRTIDSKTYYGWPTTNALILKLMPSAIIFSDAGPGCRWVGNEAGFSEPTSWQTIKLAGMHPGVSHDRLARGDRPSHETSWVGVECDVSIRPGWFYHAEEDTKVKSPEQLGDIYWRSVGYGANLLLNIPPDRRGLIHENDEASLRAFGAWLRTTFAADLASGKPASGDSRPGHTAGMTTDGDPKTWWSPREGARAGEFTVEFGSPATLSVVRIKEAIEVGQRVEEFAVDVRVGGAWREFGTGTTIGPRRIVRVSRQDAVRADALRVRITKSLDVPAIASVEAFLEAEIAKPETPRPQTPKPPAPPSQ